MPTTLKVWSFHKSISKAAKEDLLKHFGAMTVQHIGRQGRDEAVLASFKNKNDCKYALGRLHQQEVLGVRLKAVYKDSALPPPTQNPHRCNENAIPDDSTTQEEKIQKKIKEFEVNLCSIAPALGINHPIPPSLRYLYPPPSASVIGNIAQALIEVPRFYTQVLHLMNKMNLPPPFHPVRCLLPIHQELLEVLGHYKAQKSTEATVTSSNYEGGDNENGMDNPDQKLSESESELESDREGERSTRPPAPIKRRIRPLKAMRKRPKLSLLKQTCVSVSHPRPPEVSVRDVFETTETQGLRRLELRVKDAVLPKKEDSVIGQSLEESGSFGKMETLSTHPKDHPSSESMVEWPREADKYIKREDILNNRVAKSEWPILPVFKNYTPGEPSVKLYIKNLAKTTTEKDLKYIFGHYVFWQNEEEASLFSISLMKEGRMKGQAFITFPEVSQASEALNDTNGFILNDKPMVVAFGRVKKEQSKDDTGKE